MRWPGPHDSYLLHKDDIDAAIRSVLDSGWYILGDEVVRIEREFASYIGAADAVGVASGTDAILVGLLASGVQQGDRVATVSHTAVATVAAIEMAGAEPILVDIDPQTMTMCPDSLERTIRHVGGVRVILPVHLYGHPADMSRIVPVAEATGALLLEDCAQAHGATTAGRKVGTWGVAAAFSCYPTKNLGALGDAGLLTATPAIAERARQLRQYGWRERYISETKGVNSRLDPLQAAVLSVKLPHLDALNRRRREVAGWYDQLLPSWVRKPTVASGVDHVFHQYVIRTADRDATFERLTAHGVPVGILYPQPVHLQPAYRDRLLVDPAGLPVSEEVCESLLCLPMHPLLTRDAVQRVVEVLEQRT